MPRPPNDEDLDLDDDNRSGASDSSASSTSPFSPPITLGGLPPLDPFNPFSPQRGMAAQQRPKSPGGAGRGGLPLFHSLESLYAHVRELGTDEARLRVERLEPEWVQAQDGGRVPVAGVIAYLDGTPSMQDFANRFGGRKYRVFAEQQVKDRVNGDEPRLMDVAMAEFRFPLDPNLDELPILNEQQDSPGGTGFQFPGQDQGTPYRNFSPMRRNNTFFMQNPQTSTGQQFAPRDALEMVKAGVEFARNGQQGGDNSSSLNFLSGLTQQQAVAAKAYSDEQAKILKDQILERDVQAREMRAELRELKNRPTSQGETLAGLAQVVGALKVSSSDQDSAHLRSSHEREVDRLNDQHSREKESLKREHDRDLIAIRAEAKADKDRWLERERDLMRDADRQQQILREEMERRERSAKSDAEREVSMMRHNYESQMNAMRQSYDDKVGMAKMHGEVLRSQSETSSSVVIQTLQEKVATLSAEANRFRHESETLRAQVNKSVPEAIQEAHSLARMTGLVSRDELQAGADVGPKSRTDMILEKMAEGAVAIAPQLLQGLGGIATGLAGRAATPAPAAPQHVRVEQVRPQQRSPQQPVFVSDDAASFVSMKQLPHAEQHQQPPTARPARMPAPTQQTTAAPTAAVRAVDHGPPESPWAGFEWTSLEPDALQSIFSIIERAHVAKEPPESAVAQLQAAHGRETISVVALFAPAEKVVASMQRAPATRATALATQAGRRFVRELWRIILSEEAAKEPAVTLQQQAGVS